MKGRTSLLILCDYVLHTGRTGRSKKGSTNLLEGRHLCLQPLPIALALCSLLPRILQLLAQGADLQGKSVRWRRKEDVSMEPGRGCLPSGTGTALLSISKFELCTEEK